MYSDFSLKPDCRPHEQPALASTTSINVLATLYIYHRRHDTLDTFPLTLIASRHVLTYQSRPHRLWLLHQMLPFTIHPAQPRSSSLRLLATQTRANRSFRRQRRRTLRSRLPQCQTLPNSRSILRRPSDRSSHHLHRPRLPRSVRRTGTESQQAW